MSRRIKTLLTNQKSQHCLLGLMSLLLFFFAFLGNFPGLANKNWFKYYQRDSESLVIGRIIESRQEGFLSEGGFLGQALQRPEDFFTEDAINNQYVAYLKNDRSFKEYVSYNSQPGGQGFFFSVLDTLLPFSNHIKLNIFYIVNSFISAAALTFIVLWFSKEIGPSSAFFVLIFTLLSQWLIVFGRNLYWCIWAFYLPMIGVMYYIRKYNTSNQFNFLHYSLYVFLLVLIKCLTNGYEYITSTLIMMTVPIIYYSLIKMNEKLFFIKMFIISTVSSISAVIFSMIILCFQNLILTGSMKNGLDDIIFAFRKRTHADFAEFPAEYAESLQSDTLPIIVDYLKGTYTNVSNIINISNSFVKKLVAVEYYEIILFFLFITILLRLHQKKVNKEIKQRIQAINITLWFSILAPVSWFIIFKSHAYEHMHTDFIVWQMPFTLFGAAATGLYVSFLLGTK